MDHRRRVRLTNARGELPRQGNSISTAMLRESSTGEEARHHLCAADPANLGCDQLRDGAQHREHVEALRTGRNIEQGD